MLRNWSRYLQIFMLVTLVMSQTVEAKRKKPVVRFNAEKYASAVIDADTGHVLFSENFDQKRYPASLTKMMTLYLLFDALEKKRFTLNQRLPVSKKASYAEPSKLGLKEGETIRVKDCINALIVKSANDVAIVVAEAIGGSVKGFVKIMNNQAVLLGMRNTLFQNANGLPHKKQQTTARDMTMLSRALLDHHKKHYRLFSQKRFKFRGRVYRGHNNLLGKVWGVDGMKTGYIRASGFNLATSAKRHGRRVIVVVFGGNRAKWRDQKVAELVEKGFKMMPKIRVAEYRNPPLPPAESLLRLAQKAPASVSNTKVHLVSDIQYPKKTWGIQVGAYRSYEKALQSANSFIENLPRKMVQPQIMIVEAQLGYVTLYRSRIFGFNERTSKKACQLISIDGSGCVILSPDMHIRDAWLDLRKHNPSS